MCGADMIYTQAPSGGVFRGLRVSAWVTMRESVRRDAGLKDGKQTRASDKHPHPPSSRSRHVCVLGCVCAVGCVAQSSRAHLEKCRFFSAFLSPSPVAHFSFFFFVTDFKEGTCFPALAHTQREKSTAAAGNHLCKRCGDCVRF